MNTDDISFRFFSALDPNKIELFNKEMYAKEVTPRIEDLAWQFRVGFRENVEPIYILYKNEIVGQAGLTSVLLNKGGKQEVATWFNNFIVSSSLQGMGFGKLLTEKWMSISNVHLTNCNDKSMAVFKKYGWKETFDTVRFALPLDIYKAATSKNWGGVKLATAYMANPLYKMFHRLRSVQSKFIKPQPISNFTAKNLVSFFPQDQLNSIVHDEAWFQWRFLSGYLSKQYFVMQYENATLIFREFQYVNMKRLHIVLQTESESASNHTLTRAIVKYASKNKVDLIWTMTNISCLKNLYSSILKHQLASRFAFHANDKVIFNDIEIKALPVQSADSDYDTMYV
jgi:hypothetical protein